MHQMSHILKAPFLLPFLNNYDSVSYLKKDFWGTSWFFSRPPNLSKGEHVLVVLTWQGPSKAAADIL